MMQIYKIILVLALLSLLVLSLLPQRAIAEPVEISVAEEVVMTLEQHLEKIFGDNAEVALAVLKHESQLKLDAKGWNCHYYKTVIVDEKEVQRRYSTSCKIADRGNAWSVDCGIGQINTKGKVCPARLLTLEGNMEAVEKIYKAQGLNAWVSYKTGRYKKYL